MAMLPDNCKTPAELRKKREARITDAIALRDTDRVPVMCSMGYFPARYAGISCSAAYYDFDAWYSAYKKTIPDFPADLIYPQRFTPGTALEILAPKQIRWPGFNADSHYGHQAVEVDYMKADEYDEFINDPSDYWLRKHISRTSEKLAGLSEIPNLLSMENGFIGAQALSMALSSPQVKSAMNTLIKTGNEFRRWQKKMEKFDRLLRNMGFPQFCEGAAMPPFDIISHSMRGFTGTITDMYRQPDRLIAACKKILEKTLSRPLPPPNEYGNTRMFMTNTRGSDDFLSKEQFDAFYWPTFKKLVMGIIEKGGTPSIFFEGNFTSKLEYLLEFPRGSILVYLDTTDIFRAKDVLKGHLCIQGNLPSSLLQVGSVQEVKDYCKKLIDIVGKGGGYILSPRSSTDEVKPENLKAMIDFTREYGKY